MAVSRAPAKRAATVLKCTEDAISTFNPTCTVEVDVLLWVQLMIKVQRLMIIIALHVCKRLFQATRQQYYAACTKCDGSFQDIGVSASA